ncbi:MAG: hypothetical protein IPM25_16000 [Chloracidobacterium sp.]|nr:hypothetical protein [Chloracidobacterium sp.]
MVTTVLLRVRASTFALLLVSCLVMLVPAGQVRGQMPDDSFTFFKAEVVNAPGNTYKWYPNPEINFPGAAKGSPMRLVVKRGGKEVYSHTCPLAGRSGTQTQACYDRNSSIAEVGLFDVEIYLDNGSTGNSKLVRKYKIDVRKTTKQGGRRPEFYIQRHADAAVGYLSKNLRNVLFLNTVFSPVEDYGATFGYTPILKCSVNGRPVDIADNGTAFRQANARVINGFSESFDAKRVIQRDTIRFDQMEIQLPLTLGAVVNPTVGYGRGWVDVTKTPGKWQCDIFGDRSNAKFRTLKFEVAGGSILPHPEQKTGNVNLDKDKWLIELEIPPGGSEIDKRLLPSPETGLFYGIPWATPEGKALAARVPRKGAAFP